MCFSAMADLNKMDSGGPWVCGVACRRAACGPGKSDGCSTVDTRRAAARRRSIWVRYGAALPCTKSALSFPFDRQSLLTRA